jgi:hypothetical protein
VSAGVSELARGTTYHFRLKAANANGPGESADATFTTAGLPVFDEESAIPVGTAVTFRARINPSRLDTTCEVQYVSDAGYKASRYASAATVPRTP